MLTEIMDFGILSPTEIPVKINGVEYLLKEATGDAVCQYRNATIKSMKFSDQGKATGFDGVADSEPLLVSLCLFNSEGNNVDIATVRKWPAHVMKALFNKAKEISDLAEGNESLKDLEKQQAELAQKIAKLKAEPSKNLLSSMPTGSE